MLSQDMTPIHRGLVFASDHSRGVEMIRVEVDEVAFGESACVQGLLQVGYGFAV